MVEQEKLTRNQVLEQLSITEDTLSLYEHELEMDAGPSSSGSDSFTEEDLKSIKILHKLRESGLTYNEIKLLSSLSDVLKNVELEEKSEIKNLLALSPIYRLKQSLNLTRQELNEIRNKAQELEESLKREVETRKLLATGDISLLQVELETKQKALSSLEKKLSEALREGKPQVQIKGKKAKELYETIVQKDLEIVEIKKKSEELLKELNDSQGESLELKERIDLMEDDIAEMEHEVEERYQEQITNLREQIEALVDKKQKEWETYYNQTSEQHRKELLTLVRRHEQEILRLKQKIKEQIEEIELLKIQKNPLLGLLKVVGR